MLVAANYGYFRDELYYIADGQHLQAGYVDQPLLMGWLAALMRVVAGDGLVALHVIPALACAMTIVVTGLMARELGGGRLAQLVAGVAALFTLDFIGTGSLFSMDVLDQLWWALAGLILVRLLRRKWHTFYAPEARDLQRRFFDHFLKGAPNGWDATPRVRLAVRRSREIADVRAEPDWPLAGVTYVPLYLDAVAETLHPESPREEGVVRYDPRARIRGPRGRPDRASFVHRFEHDAELTGGMTLHLWVSTSVGVDMDLFVLLRKFDALGNEVFFNGYNGFAKDGVAKGWLRVSHRALNPARSQPGRPWHTHAQRQSVRPGEVMPVEIEILASSTSFEAGASLRLDVLGHDAAKYPAFRHSRSVNSGEHTIHAGGNYPSALLTPFAKR